MNAREDERRHEPGDTLAFAESWYVDFSREDGTGGYVMLSLVPGSGVAWYWAALVSPDFGAVVVRDDEVTIPREPGLEVRAEGLWAEAICETPMEHWSYGLEAFGLRYDDPAEAYRGELGERLPVGFDLEWEVASPRYDYPFPDGFPIAHYEHAGVVHGELLVGDVRVPFEGRGSRDHAWGMRDWSATAWSWCAFQIGEHFAASFVVPEGLDGPDGVGLAYGSTWRLGEEPRPVHSARVETHLGPEGIPSAARAVIAVSDGHPGLEIDIEVLAPAPVLVRGPDGPVSRFPRALCRFSCAEGTGTGWTEWNQPL